jgi:hypothetical protein
MKYIIALVLLIASPGCQTKPDDTECRIDKNIDSLLDATPNNPVTKEQIYYLLKQIHRCAHKKD